MSTEGIEYQNIGFVEHALDNAEVESLRFAVPAEGGEGAAIACYLPMGLDELTEPDERGLAYDIEARVLADRGSWTMEEIAYEPMFVDDRHRIVLAVRGIVWPE